MNNILTAIQIEILKSLSPNHYVTADEIAQIIGYSNRTIRTNLQVLKQMLEDFGCEIVSKPRYGYKLEITDEDLFNEYRSKHLSPLKTKVGLNDRNQRVKFIVNLLVNNAKYYKIDDIIEEMFISRSTFTNDFKEVLRIFDGNNLRVIRRSNYGIKVVGDEINKRRVLEICNNYIDDSEDTQESRDIKEISRILVKYNNRHQISLSETNYRSILQAIYIQIQRIKSGNCLSESKEEEFPIVSQSIATSIAKELETVYNISYNEDEILYFSLHLISKGFYAQSNTIEISQNMEKLLDNMLGEVNSEFGIDFSNDFDLRMQMIHHLIPMDIRIRYDFNCDNPLVNQIREKYTYSFEIATQSAVALVKYYNKPISQEEIGLLAIFFELALERIGKDSHRSSILVVCGSGKGSSQLLKFKFKNEFGEYLDNVFVCDIFQLESFDLSKVDYVFSTVPITVKIGLPVHEVSLFLDNEDISKIKKVLKGNEYDLVSKYFKPEHFISNLKANTKEEVIMTLVDLLSSQYEIQEGVFDSIMQREHIAPTEYGNGVAMPHAMKSVSEDTIVYIAILEQPIVWSEKKVQLIILTLIGNKKDDSIQDYYNAVVNIVYDSKNLYRLVKERDFEIIKAIINEG